MKIIVRWREGDLTGTLNNTPNAKAVYESLPVEAMAYTDEAELLKVLGELFIRMMSWLSYAY